MPPSILITGGISKISKKLVQKLLEDGQNQVVLLHNSTDDQIPQNLLTNSNLKLVNLSSINEDCIRNLINSNRISTVFDVSLTTSNAHLPPLQGAKTLILGITSVLDAIRTSETIPSLVVVSGEEVYGSSTSVRVETQPLEPVSFVGAAQMSVEAMVHSYAVSYRIPIVIGRLPRVVLSDKYDLEGIPKDTLINILSISDAINGIINISKLANGQKPAEVFNITNSFDFNPNDFSKFQPSRGPSNQKLVSTGVWRPSEGLIFEDYPVEQPLQPLFLLYGAPGDVKNQFLELAKVEGLRVMESGVTNFQEASDKLVMEEINSVNPSHLVYFGNQNEEFNGDCFTLRTNMATNLYFPWLLASISEKTSIHFTHIGTSSTASEDVTSSAEAVKGFTGKMLEYFENTLRIGPNVNGKTVELMKQRKTGAVFNDNNNF